METELHLTVEHAAQSLHQAIGFMVHFADSHNLVQGRAGGNGESILVDDLVAGVEFGDDEMDGGA